MKMFCCNQLSLSFILLFCYHWLLKLCVAILSPGVTIVFTNHTICTKCQSWLPMQKKNNYLFSFEMSACEIECAWPLSACVHSWQCLDVLLISQQMSWVSSSQTWIRESVLSSRTVCGGTWWRCMQWYIMSDRSSIEFRSGEREGKSVASLSSSLCNCPHTVAAWCHEASNPEDFIPEPHSIHCWPWLAMRSVQLSKETPAQIITVPPPNQVLPDNVTSCITFTTASPDSWMSL